MTATEQAPTTDATAPAWAGINHLALTCETREDLDRIRHECSGHGWSEMYADRYPHAGGEGHVALYLENSEAFEVEIVVD